MSAADPATRAPDDPSVAVRVSRWFVRLGQRLAAAECGRGGWLVRALPWILLLVVAARSLPETLRGNDFAVYYAAGDAALSGEDIFESPGFEPWRGFIYPPTLAALVAPLAALPFPAAAVCWTLLLAAALVVSLRCTMRLVGVGTAAERWTVGALTLLVVARPLDSEFGNGQANLVVLSCALLGAASLADGRDVRGGIWMALAACLKATPAILIGYLVLSRRWRAAAGWALGLVLFLVVLPAAVSRDPSAGLRGTAAWSRRVAAPFLEAPERPRDGPREDATGSDPPRRGPHAQRVALANAYAPGHSLRALAFRYFSASPLDFQDVAHPQFVTIVDLGRRNAQLVYAGLALIVLLITALASGIRAPPGDRDRVLLDVSVWLLAMLLVSPISRKAHFVALLPAAACGAVLVLREPRSRAVLWVLGCAAVYVLVADRFTGERVAEVLREGGLYTATALVPWAVLAWRAHRGRGLPAVARDATSP